MCERVNMCECIHVCIVLQSVVCEVHLELSLWVPCGYVSGVLRVESIHLYTQTSRLFIDLGGAH